MKVMRETSLYSMSKGELDELWNYCQELLETWQGNEEILNHSESFLVAYCIKLFNQMKLKGMNPNPKMMREALLKRYPVDSVNKFIILGKDISKRGIPIYKI